MTDNEFKTYLAKASYRELESVANAIGWTTLHHPQRFILVAQLGVSAKAKAEVEQRVAFMDSQDGCPND